MRMYQSTDPTTIKDRLMNINDATWRSPGTPIGLAALQTGLIINLLNSRYRKKLINEYKPNIPS